MGAQTAYARARRHDKASRRVAARPRVPWAGLAAAAGVAVWLLVDPRTPDLAAQVYRVSLFRHVGFAVWDEHWYAGHALPGYSLLFGPLAVLLGLRTVAALSVLVSAVLCERLLRERYGEAARWGAVWFALAAVADIWIGRLTFALGVAFAVACLLVLWGGAPESRAARKVRGRGWIRTGAAAGLAVLCAAASPVAGLLLALLALTYSLLARSPRAVLVAGVPAVAVAVALAALFPEGGWEPYPFTSFLATAAAVAGFLLVLPARERGLRGGALVYLGVCVLSVALHTPMGANVERFGLLLGAPLLLCALVRTGGVRAGRGGLFAPAVALVLCGLAVWTLWGPVRETAAVVGDPSTGAAYYVPLERFLTSHGGSVVRVEVPFTRSHWEAAWLAPSVSLARGWEKQLDTRYDLVLLRPGLTAGAYRAWLQQQAVSYVALPDVPLDPSSSQEGRLIARGLPYLKEVFASAHWRVYRVLGATPLVQGPGRLTALGHDSFALLAAPGRLLVRVHYTRYWTLTEGAGCVGPAAGGWTAVDVARAGGVGVAARFSLGRALGGGGWTCSSGVSEGGAGGALGGGLRGDGSGASGYGFGGRYGGGGGGDGSGAGSAGAQAAGYRWFVPTHGPPPSIAQENAAQGTAAWRLPGAGGAGGGALGGEGHGPVEGYVSHQALAPGQRETVYVNAPGARTVTLSVFRMGWYHGTGGRLVMRSRALPAVTQPGCTHRVWTGLTECRWRPTGSFLILKSLPSGVYTVKLSTDRGAQRDCLFVVRAARPSRLLVVIPTATYEAYNSWGGDSLYPGGRRVGVTGSTQGVEVSYDRPYASQTGAGQFFIREVAAVRFLERHGYPVSYTTSESLDGAPGQVRGVRAVLDVGHSEYWSVREAGALMRARDAGTSLVFLSSDTLAWRVRFARATRASSQAGEGDHVLVAYKEFAARAPRGEPTGLFPLGGAPLVGSAYDGCITPRLPQVGPPVYRYYPWAPVSSLRPRWLFAHTGVRASTRIPGIVGYELDQLTPFAPPGTRVVGSGTGVPCQSEAEPSPVRGYTADTTVYTARSGALVFATGTLGWLYGLSPVPQASPDAPRAPDRRVVAMTENVLARALSAG
jgi:N,N-dimethylformamidase beta subunit-like, C-terminal